MTKTQRTRIFLVVLTLLVICVLDCFLEPLMLRVSTFDIFDRDLPPGFVGKTIVFCADIHHGSAVPRGRVRCIVRKIMAQHPDIVLLGGDYVDKGAQHIAPVFAELSHLKAPLGVFGVPGNHDHWEGIAASRLHMARAGIRSLENCGFWLKSSSDSIRVGGVGDLWEGKQLPGCTLDAAKPGDFCVLVSHNPDYFETARLEGRLDLGLAGHTHGGQINLFGFHAPFVPSRFGQKYREGLVLSPNGPVFITTGAGSINPRVRFFCRPEIVVIRLGRGK